jgi:ADP-heptose:LPS heptosyltransferase
MPISRFFFDRTREHFKLTRGAPDRLFDDCARLTLGREAILGALRTLGLRELGPSERRLVVHPGSGGRAKRWPLRNFAEIIRQAAGRGVGGVLVTGEAEVDIEPEVREHTLPAGWGRASCLATETLAGLLASSTHYIGNDSGPTHLAAACGASVLALFCDENLPAWRPFGRTRVLSAPAVERISVETVRAVLDDFLGYA